MPKVPSDPQIPFSELPEFPASLAKVLKAEGLSNPLTLFRHYPKRHENRAVFPAFPTTSSSEPSLFCGRVESVSFRRLGGKRSMTLVEVGDPLDIAAPITLRWFNLGYLYRSFSEGQELALFGRPKEYGDGLVVDHPDHEILPSEDAPPHPHRQKHTPVYPPIKGIPQGRLRELMTQFIGSLLPGSLPNYLPTPSHEGEFAGLDRATAIRQLHFPESEQQRSLAHRYLALEELVALQLPILMQRRRIDAQERKRSEVLITTEPSLSAEFLTSLPFALTSAQDRAVEEIGADLRRPRPMARLLQGDVGSGKTVVAACAALQSIAQEGMVALMAPTQILAEQHFSTFSEWLTPLGITVGIRTASQKENRGVSGEQPELVIGTHALLFEKTEFPEPDLVIIDEQHKFGVEQRARLLARGDCPDLLVMTATPIPRTLTLALYGDLDVSIIDELPPGRGEIITGLRPGAKIREVTKFVKEQLEAGRQAYIVYPRIEDTKKSKLRSTEEEFPKWQKRLGKKHPVGLVHGRLRPEEKEAAMEAFRCGDTHALVCTTVIEVGVDVPNANIMLIHDAERFGLPQLHQLRGRIGRSSHRSYCILLPSPKADTERLEILEKSRDGFVIAEEDLRQRGPGELLGRAQSGTGGMQLSDLLSDIRLVKLARRLAGDILTQDPELSTEVGERWRQCLPEQTSTPDRLE